MENEIEKFAFSTFDPNFKFDPDAFEGDADNAAGKVKRLRSQANLDLSITNNLGSTQRIELFNALRSFSKINNPQVVALATAKASTVENIIQSPAATTENNLIFFDENGSLVVQNGSGLKLTVSGNQVPYRVLFDATIQSPFIIDRLRMTVTTDGQIDKPITYVRNTFLGVQSANVITPRSYQSPMQQQSKIIDITQSFPIDSQSGFTFDILNGETVTLQMFLSVYQTIGDARKLR